MNNQKLPTNQPLIIDGDVFPRSPRKVVTNLGMGVAAVAVAAFLIWYGSTGSGPRSWYVLIGGIIWSVPATVLLIVSTRSLFVPERVIVGHAALQIVRGSDRVHLHVPFENLRAVELSRYPSSNGVDVIAVQLHDPYDSDTFYTDGPEAFELFRKEGMDYPLEDEYSESLGFILNRIRERFDAVQSQSPAAIDGAAIAHDFSTPEGAILRLEDAYRARDLEAAIACKDFLTEARIMMADKPVCADADAEALLKQAAEVLELAYRQEKEQDGFPDMTGVRSTFAQRETVADGIVKVTEIVHQTNGETSREELLVGQTNDGWRVLNSLS